MHFRYQNKVQILNIEDSFAHLFEIDDLGNLHFRLTYSVSQKAAIQHRALRVRVRIIARNVARKQVLAQSARGIIDTRAVVNNARTIVTDAKTTAEQQTAYILASKFSDISSKINNEVLSQLRAQAPIGDIPYFSRPRLQLASALQSRQNNDPQPVLHTVLINDLQSVLTSSANQDPRQLMHQMITQHGQDPTQIFSLTTRSSSESSTHGGLTNSGQAQESSTDPISKLLNYHLFPPSSLAPPRTTDGLVDTELVQILSTITTDDIELTVPIVVPVGKLNIEGAPLTQVHAVFELLDPSTDMAIDAVSKLLDITQHIQVYHTPKQAPLMKLATSEASSRANLEIKQVDQGATEIDLYKKSFWVSSPEVDDYTLIGTYSLTPSDQSLFVQVDRPLSSPALYRAIPRGKQSMQGAEFANIVIKPARYVPVRSISLTALQVDTGIQLEVRQIPTNVVAIRYLRWNLTTFESDPTTVGDDVGFIDDSTREADMLVVIDGDVAYNNVYRYTAQLIYRDGGTFEAGDATTEFIKPSPGEIDTKISSLQVDHDNTPNVTFSIDTVIIDTDIDAVKRMLENQGLAAYFTDDVATQRDQLKKLLAYQIHRIDLNTGQLDNFGTITDSSFDDEALRKNQSIGALQYGHRYRYVAYPLLRQPETLFDSFVKQATDVVTKKPYTYSPAKFQHPLTLRRGVIVSAAGALQRYSKDPMAHGIIGSIASIEVSFDRDTAQVTEAFATNFDRKLNLVTWRVLGDINKVDHFIVMKQVHGIRTMLGKAHAEFANGSCQYVHRISDSDVGALQFVIVPVYNDYRVGAPTATNTLMVESP